MKGIFFSFYGPNHVPDIQEYTGEHRGSYELLDVSNTIEDSDELADLLERVYRDPAISAAKFTAEKFYARPTASYKVFGSGKVRV
jgi:hypothetical protein